jgi:hypothetical protein
MEQELPTLPEHTRVFCRPRIVQSLVFCVLAFFSRLLFVHFGPFFFGYCIVSVSDLRLLISPLIY